MQFINNRKNALNRCQAGLPARLGCPVSSLLYHLTDEENSIRLFGEQVGLMVLLLHVYLIGYPFKPSEYETPTEPLVMEEALIAVPTPSQVKSVEPAPVKQKKTPVLLKKSQALLRPFSAPTPETVLVSKPEAAVAPAPATLPTPRPAVSVAANNQPEIDAFSEANY